MNLEEERKLFLYELSGHGYEFENKTWIHGMGDVGGLFDDDQLNMVWEMWRASVNREGYKLVPVELTEKMIVASFAHRDCGDDYCIADIYKEMIGACDE